MEEVDITKLDFDYKNLKDAENFIEKLKMNLLQIKI